MQTIFDQILTICATAEDAGAGLREIAALVRQTPARWLLHRKAGEGCDYSIRCGEALDLLTNTEATDLIVQAILLDLAPGSESIIAESIEGRYSSVVLYLVAGQVNIDMPALRLRWAAKEQSRREAEELAAKRAMYERLKADLEKE